MKTDRERERDQKIVFVGFVLTLVVTSASTLVAGKYPDYDEYAEWGLYIYAGLLLLVAGFFLFRKKNAA